MVSSNGHSVAWPSLPRFRIPESPCSPRLSLLVSESWWVWSPVLIPDAQSALPDSDTWLDFYNTSPVVSALASIPSGEFALCVYLCSLFYFRLFIFMHILPSVSMIEIVLCSDRTLAFGIKSIRSPAKVGIGYYKAVKLPAR